MKIGVPKEIKNHEYRVGLTPESVAEILKNNHEVFIQKDAGSEIGFSNEAYESAGATIIDSAKELYELSELIVKVKEPIPEEFQYLNSNHTVFAYLHLAGDPKTGLELASTGITGIALETVTADNGTMPLLSPMSAIAGQLSIVVGSYHLLKPNKGMGTLIGAFQDVEPRVVTVIGAGVAGTEAIEKAIDNKAHLKIIDLSDKRLNELETIYGNKNIEYILSTETAIESALMESDLVIGAVYVIGKQAPKVVKNSMLKQMKPGAVMVDISIDQGGCFESSKPTTHADPTYEQDGIIHYCVTNMPGAVPNTSNTALTNATLKYALQLANKGWKKACSESKALEKGLNIAYGKVIYKEVAEAFNLEYTKASSLIH